MARRVPVDLEDALAASPTARERFWSMPSQQKDAWVAWVDRGRFPGARRRRVADAVRRLGGRTEIEHGVVPLPRDWSAWVLGLVLLAGLAAFLVWLTVFRDRGHETRPSAVVVTAKSTVPKVTGIRYQAAQFQLQQAKLTVKVVRRNASRPRGIVIGQRPQHGRSVAQGSTVVLAVSNGPPRVELPDVVGLAAADAVRALQARKLAPQLEQRPSAQPPGTVLAQTPKPGTHTKPGRSVVLLVAAPQATTAQATTAQTTTAAAPTTTARSTTTQARTTTQATTTSGLKPPASGNDYTGMRLRDAVQQIVQGRQQVIVTYAGSNQPLGVVLSSSRAGSREQLQVSAGPRPKPAHSVPDVSEEDLSTAEQDLRAAGFFIVPVDWPVSDASRDGVVVAQTPAAGTSIPQGVVVVVYIGSAAGG
jgi:beta-lactam-binding protein with PASTA domain